MEPYGIHTFANIGGQLGDTQWIPIRLHKGDTWELSMELCKGYLGDYLGYSIGGLSMRLHRG
jgi:hypothetical protein